ncbi:MAG: septum site-determining protein MinC [Cytophagales bacterium]|nr:septum site-determining protein MinC [Armatimonadota bacterium]
MSEQEQEAERADVEVKGWRNGLLLILPPGGEWQIVLERVDARLDEARARSFWRGAQTTIDCGERVVPLDELDLLLDRVKRAYGLVPIAIVAADAATRAAGEKLALVSYEEMPVIRKPAPRERGAASSEAPVAESSDKAPASTNNALYLYQTVRSGQRIVHDGHLVICGDVNAGSELVAKGDVVVFGTLRGLAHAGCYGDEGARIVAVSLRPPQLRIAGKIARSPEESGGAKSSAATRTPEVARIENGEIQIFPQ